MLFNYLKIAVRNLLRYKAYSFINLVGLAIGMAACLCVAVFVRYQYAFDQFHADTIYRLYEIHNQLGQAQSVAQTRFPMGPTLQQEFAEIKNTVRITSWEQVPLQHSDQSVSMGTLFGTDPSFPTVFNFRLLRGNAKTALAKPGTIVLTQKLARQLFGNEDPMGQLVQHRGRDTINFVVSGILQDIPRQSHLQFDALFSHELKETPDWMTNWEQSWVFTYVQLTDRAEADRLKAKFPAYLRKYVGTKKVPPFRLALQPLTLVHRASAEMTHDLINQHKFDGSYLPLMLLVAGFVLLLAIINYVNLTTARSLSRAKEVGVRKTSGANWQHVVVQFLGETLLYAGLSLLIAFGLVQVALPLLNRLTDLDLTFNPLLEPGWLLISVGVAVATGLLAGLLPAVLLAGLRPALVLKNQRWMSVRSPLRNALVVAQFTIAVGLSMASLTAFRQLSFIQHYDVGFNKEQVVVLPVSWTNRQQVEALLGHLRQVPGVLAATGSLRRLGTSIDQNRVVFTGRQGTHRLRGATMFVDYNYVPFYGIQVVAGRNLSAEYGQDRRGDSYLVNETMARQLLSYAGQPRAPLATLLGQSFRYDFADSSGTIVGIVRDFNFNSLHQRVEPLCLSYLHEYYFSELSVRLDGGRTEGVLADIEQAWKHFLPDQRLRYFFLDDQLERLYQSDRQVSSLVGVLTCLALLIACFGLIGLVTFTLERRLKEIGVRKVLGASVASIIALLSKDFLRLVLIGIGVGLPTGWWVMERWLADFAYRITISWDLFVAVGSLTILLALLTVSFQSIKAALMNPVKSLRTE